MYPRNKGFFKGLGLLLAIIMGAMVLWAAPGGQQPAQAANSPINSAVQYLYEEYTVKGLANNDMGVGSYAFYVLHRAGVDVGDWQHTGISLEEAVIEEINKNLSNSTGLSAKLLAQDLTAAAILEREDLVDGLLQALIDKESCTGFDHNIYSDIPAYELLGRIGRLGMMDAGLAKECLLAAQNKTADDADYGSFGGDWGPDFMTTAQAVRALHYLDLDAGDSEIQQAISTALGWLQGKQQTDGGFLGSEWDDPVTDTAEVIITLVALGQDPASLLSSSGKTARDYMLNEVFDAAGDLISPDSNLMDATWALCAYSLLDIVTPEIPISPADYALEFLRNEYVTKGLANNDMGVGSYAFYVLHQAGVDVGGWQHEGNSLEEAVIGEINTDLSNSAGLSAKLLAQDLTAAAILEKQDLVDELLQALKDRESSTGFDRNIYSDIPAYELLGRLGRLGVMDAGLAKECLLAAQNKTADDADYGSFGGDWGPDFMTTAQAVRALHYLDPGAGDSEIQQAISAALCWLQDKQQADGGFLGSEWDDPVTDTAEVIITLVALGQDPDSLLSSSGNTAVDYMLNEIFNAVGDFISPDGNLMDATWALCAYNLLDNQFYLHTAATTLKIGDTIQLQVFWQADGDTADVTQDAVWSVADGTIVSVDQAGLVIALASGATKVTAVYNGLTAAAQVTVESSTPGGGNVGTDITVGLAVVGQGNKLLYGPSYVSVDKSNKWGLTALGALEASGIDYQTNSWSYGDFVFCIEGQANSGLSGWMYTVNDVIPGGGADKYNISDKDKIIFYYSESMDQQPPGWDGLGEPNVSGGGASLVDQLEPVKDADLQAAIKNARDTGRVTLAAESNSTALALSGEQVTRIHNTDVPLVVTIQGAQFILSPDSLKIKELAADQSTMLEFAAQKLSSGAATELTDLFPTWLKLTGDIYELTIQTLDRDDTPQDISLFPDCQVCLPVPADIAANTAEMLKAYRYNEDSRQWVNMGGTYDKNQRLISFPVDHFSKYALLEVVQPPEEEVVFLDTMGHWAQAEVAYMAAAGYVAGVGEKLFAPDAQITRAEFTAVLARMAGLLPNPAAAACFNDVPVDAWYRGAVGAATAAGLVYGSNENSFAPEALVTREQMAAILVRFMAKNGVGPAEEEVTGNNGLPLVFSDSGEISSWAQLPVAQAVDSELLVGREKDKFAPQGSATRAEATVVLYRALQKLP